MKRKTKQNALLIFIASLPLIGSIYYTNSIRQNQVDAVDTPKITLNSSNTPTGVEDTIIWNDPLTNQPRTSFEQKVRYTNFHYKQVTKIGNEHITFPREGGYYIQNSSPLNDYRIANYSIEFKISTQKKDWAGVEVKTSNYYNEELVGYNNEIVCTLNAWDNKVSSKIYNITLTKPYFSISYAGGPDIALEYLEIYYSC